MLFYLHRFMLQSTIAVKKMSQWTLIYINPENSIRIKGDNSLIYINPENSIRIKGDNSLIYINPENSIRIKGDNSNGDFISCNVFESQVKDRVISL